jgi:uncharacterized protein (TIGR03437 family)
MPRKSIPTRPLALVLLAFALAGCGGSSRVGIGEGLSDSTAASPTPSVSPSPEAPATLPPLSVDPQQAGFISRDPVTSLRPQNSAGGLASISGGQIASAFGTGLADVNRVYVRAVGKKGENLGAWEARLLYGSDTQLNFAVPEIWVGTGSHVVVSAYHAEAAQPSPQTPFELVAEGTVFLESVAPGIFTDNQAGTGAPVGQASYQDHQGALSSEDLWGTLHPPMNGGYYSRLTFYLTGGMPLYCSDTASRPTAQATLTLLTSAGPKIAETAGYGPSETAGVQKLVADVTSLVADRMAMR